MEKLPVEMFTSRQVRAMDRHAIDAAGIAGYTLMQRAGAAALASLRQAWPAAGQLTVLCGAGNNAGDGYVLARLAQAASLAVRTTALVEPSRFTGEAAQAWSDFAAAGGRAESFTAASLTATDVIVDALLGTGIDRPVDGAMKDCIEAVNASGLPVLALDLPSGLDADTGCVLGSAIRATRTITFVALKCGLFLGAAREHVGVLEFAGLDIPAESRTGHAPLLRRIDDALVAGALPRHKATAHKGEHGRVLIVGGHAMAGAACLAGEAALRSGAGLVSVATAATSIAAIVGARPELICHAVDTAAALQPLLAAADAIAIGPGLGLNARGRELLDCVVAAGKPLVVDADALSMLAGRPLQHASWVLTPHPGEAARLLASDTGAIQRDRLRSVQAIATRYGGTCVLKGAGTLVSSSTGAPWICDRGNPGMATAGSGDVLTGIIAALLATDVNPEQSAAAGVLLHAEAGDRAAKAGQRGTIAGDLLAELRRVVNLRWN